MAHAAYPEDVKMSKEQKAEEEKWQAEEDVRTLVRAAEVRADKARMKRAMACAKEQMAAMKAATA